MNIIKIENVKRINSFHNKLEVKTNYQYNEQYSTLIILSDDDVNNDNCLLKLRGFIIDGLLIPNKYRYTFFDDTKTGKLIRPNLSKDYILSYY